MPAEEKAKKANDRCRADIDYAKSKQNDPTSDLHQQISAVDKDISSCRAKIQAEKDRQAEMRDRPLRAKRKQVARGYFTEFSKESRNPHNGEGVNYKIQCAMSDLSDFATDRINMTDFDLSRAKNLLSDLKNNREKIEIEGFAAQNEALAKKEEERRRLEKAKIREIEDQTYAIWQAEEAAEKRQNEANNLQRRLLQEQEMANEIAAKVSRGEAVYRTK